MEENKEENFDNLEGIEKRIENLFSRGKGFLLLAHQSDFYCSDKLKRVTI
jgi:hypothetical protein